MAPAIKPRRIATNQHCGTDIPQLVGDLADHDPTVRERAREALVAIGKASVPSLIGLLSHRKSHVRWEAAKTLSDIADPLAATSLVNAPGGTMTPTFAGWGRKAWTALGRDGLEPLLAALLETWPDHAGLVKARHHVCPRPSHRRRGLGPILRPRVWQPSKGPSQQSVCPWLPISPLSKTARVSGQYGAWLSPTVHAG